MNADDQALAEFQAARRIRRSAEDWLIAFEAALVSRDEASIAALFHPESHWRDVLAFTWHLTPTFGRDSIATRIAQEQARARVHNLHLPADRRPPRAVTRFGIDSIEAIFAFKTAYGRGSGVLRIAPDDQRLCPRPRPCNERPDLVHQEMDAIDVGRPVHQTGKDDRAPIRQQFRRLGGSRIAEEIQIDPGCDRRDHG